MPSKDPTRVAAGLRAALSNPNVSEEAKERALRQLDGLDDGESLDIPEETVEDMPVLGSEELDPESVNMQGPRLRVGVVREQSFH